LLNISSKQQAPNLAMSRRVLSTHLSGPQAPEEDHWFSTSRAEPAIAHALPHQAGSLAANKQPHAQRSGKRAIKRKVKSDTKTNQRIIPRKISAPFGGCDPKGPTAHALWIITTTSQAQAGVVLCLALAYTITCDTRALRPTHNDWETGQADRMPLFWTLFERFVQVRVHKGQWNVSWQHMR
jgi:hypothetical protein